MVKLKLRADGLLNTEGKYNNPFTGEPYIEEYKKFNSVWWNQFITFTERDIIFKKIHNSQILLIIAGTGVGKTVVVPKLFMHYFGYQKPIVVTVPKKKLVEGNAPFAALTLGVPFERKNEITGEKYDTGWSFVGMKHSTVKRFDDTTRLLFSTDGSLKVTITKTDPYLENYAGIMIDEAHERNISIDVLLALVARICKKRPDFKVIIMSATVSEDLFINYYKRLGMGHKFDIYKTFKPSLFKIEIQYLEKSVEISKHSEKVGETIINILKDTELMDKIFGDTNYDYNKKNELTRFLKYGRDILGFCSTSSQIDKLKQAIEQEADSFKYRPLILKFTAATTEEEQKIILGDVNLESYNKDLPPGEKPYDLKVILGTNVCESSVSFEEPLGYVIENGCSWQVKYEPKRYGTMSREHWISKANITQRRGRTGRTCNGIVKSIYTEEEWNTVIPDYEDSPITSADLTETCLEICLLPDVQNMTKCIKFFKEMIEPIENVKDNLFVAFRNLHDYDCLYKGNLTPLGRLCSKFGEFDLNIVRMIVFSYHLGGILIWTIRLACILKYCRSFNDFFDLPNDKQLKEMPEDVRNKINDMKRAYSYPSGEHLSMLNLYNTWENIPEYQKYYWEKYNKIKSGLLRNINDSVKELAEVVYTNLSEIHECKLFKYYGDSDIPMKGGNVYKTNPLMDPVGISLTKDYLFGTPTRLFNEPTKMEYEKWGPWLKNPFLCSSSPSSSSSMSCSNLFGGAGGGGEKPKKKNRQKHKKQGIKGKPVKNKKKQQKPQQKKLNMEDELVKKKIDFLENVKDGISMRGMFGQCPDIVPDLGDIQHLSPDMKIQLSLYFGFFNRVGIQKQGKNYIVKYNHEDIIDMKQNMLYSLLDKEPIFVLYHDLSLSEDYPCSFGIVSHLNFKTIDIFMKGKKDLIDRKILKY